MVREAASGKLSEGEQYNKVEFPDSTDAISPGFGTWTTADSDRPAWLEVEIYAETDGTTTAEVDVDVDETGDGTADYSFSTVSVAAVGGSETEYLKVYLPPGAQYRISNVADPSGANSINVARLVRA